VSGGGQSQDENAGCRVAECGHRFTPVLLIAIGAPFDLRDVGAVREQARAAPATHDFILQDVEHNAMASGGV